MHPIVFTEEIERLLRTDPWITALADLERLAQVLVGPSSDEWIRRGSSRAIINRSRFGSQAVKLKEELALLGTQAFAIRGESSPDGPLRAAAFYHLKFEDSIHPLRDGNGRVGRTLLAAQCGKAYGVPIKEILAEVADERNGYAMIYAPEAGEQKFELLLDVLSLILGVAVSNIALPFPLAAAYPDNGTFSSGKRLSDPARTK